MTTEQSPSADQKPVGAGKTKPMKAWAVIPTDSDGQIDFQLLFKSEDNAKWHRDSRGIWSNVIPVLIKPL